MVDTGLSLVIPAYNEEHRIAASLPELIGGLDEALPERIGAWEIIVSDDGSVDTTRGIVEGFAATEPRVRLIGSGEHHGKGAALAAGFATARHGLVLFLDADLPVPLRTIGEFCDLAADHDLVVGSRRIGTAARRRSQPPLRRAGGRAFLLATRLIGFGTGSDPQCGIKMLRRDRCAEIVGATVSAGFAFDIELIERARRGGLSVLETPVEWRHVEGSSIRPFRDALRTLDELRRLRRRLR